MIKSNILNSDEILFWTKILMKYASEYCLVQR
jgi:hypothetical protein